MMHKTAVSAPLAAHMQGMLHGGERLVWTEQPSARRFRREGYLAVPFGLACLSMAWHWLQRTPGAGVAGACVLALVGLLLMAIPYWRHVDARSTIYAVTNQRALIIDTRQQRRLRSYALADLGDWTVNRRADASGDLVLETEYYDDHDGHTQAVQHGFFAIADVRCVERILEGLQRGEDPDVLLRRAAL